MGYVSKILSSDEQVIYNGRITNFIFLEGFIFLVISFYAMFSIDIEQPNENSIISFMSFVFFIYGLYQIISKLIYKISTELAITNKRVIVKTGFIKRNTIELNHNKIESISIEQSILGRVLNYGNVLIRGTGGVLTPVKNVDNPISFRNETTNIIDK